MPHPQLLEWLGRARQFQEALRAKYGDRYFGTLDLLEEIREERLNDILGGR